MIQVSNIAAQTLNPGQSLTFSRNAPAFLHVGCGECFNAQIPTSVKLNGPNCAIYELQFEGNITSSAAGDVLQLAIAVNNTPLVETAMNATPAAVGTLVNVSTGTYFRPGCGDLDRISVINAGATPVTIAPNATLRIVRKS